MLICGILILRGASRPSPDKSSNVFPLVSGSVIVISDPIKHIIIRNIKASCKPISTEAIPNPKMPIIAPAFPAAPAIPFALQR